MSKTFSGCSGCVLFCFLLEKSRAQMCISALELGRQITLSHYENAKCAKKRQWFLVLSLSFNFEIYLIGLILWKIEKSGILEIQIFNVI